jgi:hypothetical protein
LTQFLPQAGRAYTTGRNIDTGPGLRDSVSGLSPWIRHRMLTEEQVLRAVLALAASPEAPTAARVLCYEIAWTSVAAADAGSYARLLALARVDCLHGDHPDLTLAALATISSAPPRYAPMLLGGGEDTERAMVDAMGGDAPPHVRAASITAFARVRVCEARMEAARPRARRRKRTGGRL